MLTKFPPPRAIQKKNLKCLEHLKAEKIIWYHNDLVILSSQSQCVYSF